MSSNLIIQAYDEERFRNATVSGSAPLTSYDLQTLTLDQPGARVLFASNSISITFTLPTAKQGDVFVIPVSNATSGSLNGHALAFPNASRNGVPRTLANDLTLNGASANTSAWTLALAGPAPIILGGAVRLYGPIHRVTRDILGANFGRSKNSGQTIQKNEYLTPYIQSFDTMEQTIMFSTYVTTPAELADFEDWYDGSNGGGRLGLLWLNPDIPEGHLGCWDSSLEIKKMEGTNFYIVNMKFDVWAKGKPLV
jgi:hypothetical protein